MLHRHPSSPSLSNLTLYFNLSLSVAFWRGVAYSQIIFSFNICCDRTLGDFLQRPLHALLTDLNIFVSVAQINSVGTILNGRGIAASEALLMSSVCLPGSYSTRSMYRTFSQLMEYIKPSASSTMQHPVSTIKL